MPGQGSSPGCPFLPGTAPLLGTKAAGTSLGELLCQAAPWSFLSHRTAPLQLLPRGFTPFVQSAVAKAHPVIQPGMLRAGFVCVCPCKCRHKNRRALIDRKDSLHLPFQTVQKGSFQSINSEQRDPWHKHSSAKRGSLFR